MEKFDEKGSYNVDEANYIKNSSTNFDAAESIFFARQLAYVRGKILEVPKAALNAFRVFPVQTEVPAGAQTAYQRIYDSYGMAEIISNYADDLRRVDILGAEVPVKVVDIGDSYGYSVKEIRNAQYARTNLQLYKAQAARRAIDQKLNSIAWKGDAAHNVTGFLNNPNITTVLLPATGTGGSTQIKDKTVNQIIADFNEIINTIPQATNQVEQADTILMSTAVYDYIATTPRGIDNDTTILEFLQKVHPEIRKERWIKVGELNGAASDGSDMIIAGKFQPDYVKFEIPNRFEQMQVQMRNLEYVINCISSVIGVTVTLPMAFVRVEGA